MTEGNNFVTVMVSIELLAQLQHDWSPPVQIQIESTTGGTGYVMNARNHTCPPHDENADEGFTLQCDCGQIWEFDGSGWLHIETLNGTARD